MSLKLKMKNNLAEKLKSRDTLLLLLWQFGAYKPTSYNDPGYNAIIVHEWTNLKLDHDDLHNLKRHPIF